MPGCVRWDPASGANYTRTYSEVQQGIVDSLQNKTLIITSVLVSLITAPNCCNTLGSLVVMKVLLSRVVSLSARMGYKWIAALIIP